MRYDFLLSDSCFKAVAEGPSNLFKYLAGARGGRRTGDGSLWRVLERRTQKGGKSRAERGPQSPSAESPRTKNHQDFSVVETVPGFCRLFESVSLMPGTRTVPRPPPVPGSVRKPKAEVAQPRHTPSAFKPSIHIHQSKYFLSVALTAPTPAISSRNIDSTVSPIPAS